MTQEDYELMREIAGMNEPAVRASEEAWGDAMIKNGQPKVENQLPEPTMDNFQVVQIDSSDHHINNTASRLNGLLGNEFMSTVKIERLD